MATAAQARIAEAHRQRAERHFTEVRSLARSFLFEIHDSLRHLNGSEKARLTIVKRALEYLDRLAPREPMVRCSKSWPRCRLATGLLAEACPRPTFTGF